MKEGVALSQLADILPPPVPGGPDWMQLVIAGMVCLAAAALGLWFMKRRLARQGNSSAQAARRHLAALRKEWQAHSVTDREAAYRLATLLRLGLALPQLNAQSCPNAVKDEKSWRETLGHLHALRYDDKSVSSLSPRSFDLAERWLAAARRRLS